MNFTLDAKCPGFNSALCSEKFASQWLEGSIYTVCFRTGIISFYLIISPVSAMIDAVVEVVLLCLVVGSVGGAVRTRLVRKFLRHLDFIPNTMT